MSEADRVFPRQQEQGAHTLSGEERRLIHSTPRRSGFGSGKSRVVEVVHVRLGEPRPTGQSPRAVPRNVRAETWAEGFNAKSAFPLPQQDTQGALVQPEQPTVHVMEGWKPSPRQPAQPVAEPGEPFSETASSARCRKSRTPKADAQGSARRFADPYAADDHGANCLRCGYLVEQAREQRGLMTCAGCG
jgi:hypothetical protein